MNNLIVSINPHSKEVATTKDIIGVLNDLVGHDFFLTDNSERIYWSACSNNVYHNKVIALITLWFSESPMRGYTRFGGLEKGREGEGNTSFFSINDYSGLYAFICGLRDKTRVSINIS